MLRKGLMGLVFASALVFNAGAAEVVVRVAPPVAIVETRGSAPGPGYVWIGGYHRWDGAAYAWAPGRWDAPPRPGARWVAHRWVRRHGGYVFVEGRWR
jgi:hypothetical protein